MTPPTVAAGRVVLGAATLLVVLRLEGVELPRDRSVWRRFAVTGLFASVLPFTALAWGEERITSALASVLNATTPLFTAIIAGMIGRERLRAVQVVGLATGLAGVGLAAGIGRDDLAGSTITGSLAPLFAAFCYGIAFVYVQRHLLHLPPTVAATGQLTTAAIMLLPVAVVTSVTGGFDPTPTRVVSVVLLGIGGTGLAMMIYYRVVADLGATKAALVTYLAPVVAVAAGIVVLDEPFGWRLLVGGAVVLASVAAVNGTLRVPKRLPLRPAGVGVLLVVVGLVLGACGDDDGSAGTTTTAEREATTTTEAPSGPSCDDEITEPVDPGSPRHVLPGSAEPTYATDPPTSGPHDSRPIDDPVQTEPIARARQVGQLEAGKVLVQHRDLGADEVAAVTALAGDDVIVAPNPDLPDRVVATAWVTKLVCDGPDVDGLSAFIETHAGRGPGGH